MTGNTREVKFRAWLSEVEQMDDNPALSFYPSSGNWEASGWGVPEHAILMEYTGLKDKNGVEIWEGDILRLKNSKGQTANHQEVYWNSETASFDWRTANDDSWPDGFTGFYDEYEVIGNIYESPELLERTNKSNE